jgi:GntR family transcriptional regulator
VSFEIGAPKYAQIVKALQERIETGFYPFGAMLPSEYQLVEEFGVSRSTIARALEILRYQGWVDAEQGRGRFVRRCSRPGRRARRLRPACSASPH